METKEEGRVSAYVSPEAKAMLQKMARKQFPNLHRPIGSMLERLIREEYDRRAWDEDERDMQRIANEWAAYDRDPPGS